MQPKKDKVSGDCLGVGRRKSAVARVRLRAGSGQITVNGQPFNVYFRNEIEWKQLVDTVDGVGHRETVDIDILATGGGPMGQAGACKMGIARALIAFNADNFKFLRDNGFLTRDSRMKERKKYGLRGARRGVQFSKR